MLACSDMSGENFISLIGVALGLSIGVVEVRIGVEVTEEEDCFLIIVATLVLSWDFCGVKMDELATQGNWKKRGLSGVIVTEVLEDFEFLMPTIEDSGLLMQR